MRRKLPIPEPQGNTPMERLDWAFRTVLKVPQAAILRERERTKSEREEKKRAKKVK
jgi:hypothetical protein